MAPNCQPQAFSLILFCLLKETTGRRFGKPLYRFCSKSEEAEITFTFRENNSEAHEKGCADNLLICGMLEIHITLTLHCRERQGIGPRVLYCSTGFWGPLLPPSSRLTPSNWRVVHHLRCCPPASLHGKKCPANLKPGKKFFQNGTDPIPDAVSAFQWSYSWFCSWLRTLQRGRAVIKRTHPMPRTREFGQQLLHLSWLSSPHRTAARKTHGLIQRSD